MLKKGLVLSIIVILVLSLFLVSCAQPEQEDEDKIVFATDQPYSIDYTEGLANCNMSLDGQGNCSITKEYSYESPIDEENLITVTFLKNKSFFLNYQESEFSIYETFSFAQNNELVVYDSANSSSYLSFKDVLGQVFEMSYQEKIDNMNATITLKIKPVSVEYGEYKIAIGFSINVPKYTFAQGNYEVQEERYLKLTFNYSNTDIPSTGLETYQQMPLQSGMSSLLIEEDNGRKNGLVSIADSANIHFVQLKDDGTFTFVRASTSTSSEDLYTQDTYFGKSFTTKIQSVVDGELYTYEFKLTFDSEGKATYECTLAQMNKFYRAEQEGLSQIYYDITLYNVLIGTHVQLETSNNLAFANNYIVYADYNYSRYTFEGDKAITIYALDGYTYVYLQNESGQIIVAKFYEDGSWEWVVNKFRGIDLSDHSDEF